jgi:putative metal-binding protein
MTTQFSPMLIGVLTLVGVLLPGQGVLATPPIKVNLVFEKATYSLQPNPEPEEIKFAVTLENIGDGEVLASEGFRHSPLHLLVTFIGPDGKGVTAPKLSDEETEGPPPRVLPVEGELVQVDPLEHLAPGDIASVVVPDAHSFYPLSECGRYTARVAIPIRTYPAVSRTFGGSDYADLDSADFADSLKSDPVSFTLTKDGDGDGASCPQDCDDADPAVHPGAQEIAGNGVDDDCNPATLDVVPVALIPIQIQTVKDRVPMDGVLVRMFDGASACVTQFKGKTSPKSVWLSCLSQADGLTGTAGPGGVSLGALAGGRYLFIAEEDPDATPLSGDEQYFKARVGKVKAGKPIEKVIKIKNKKP